MWLEFRRVLFRSASGLAGLEDGQFVDPPLDEDGRKSAQLQTEDGRAYIKNRGWDSIHKKPWDLKIHHFCGMNTARQITP